VLKKLQALALINVDVVLIKSQWKHL